MPERNVESSRSVGHYILGLLLFIGGLLLLLVVINLRSSADDSTSSVSIENEAPTVNNVTFSETSQGASISALSLNENTTKVLYVYGSYTDNNGCSDVTSLTLQLYQTGSASYGCTANDANCYNSASTGYTCNSASVPGDICSGGTDITANYECSVPVQYFADATDFGPYAGQFWVGRITAVDAGAASGYNQGSLTINTLTALDVGTSINYGSLALGATSAADIPLTITNTGNNNALDVAVSGSAMTCTVGSIPVSYQHYAYASGIIYGSMIALTGSPVSSDTNIPKATSVGSPSTYNSYWKLQVPSSGLAGSCSGTTTFSAV